MNNIGIISTWPRVHGFAIHTRASSDSGSNAGNVVFVHGLGVSADYMLPTLMQLASDYRVWAPELPGFGQSDKPHDALDIPELADVLAEWTKAVGIPGAVFLGNSVGCQVIVELAVRYPTLVKAAILVGPTVDSSARTMIQQLWRGLLDLIHEPWSLWRILARDYLRTGTRRMFRTFQFALNDRVTEKCSQVAAPTLLIRGSLDTIAPTRWLEELAALIPGARLVVIPGGTHATNYSTPDELVHATRAFLRRK